MKASPLNLTLAIITLIGGLLLTGIGANQSRLHHHNEAQYRFERLADRLGAEVQRRMNQLATGLKSARGLFAASTSVERLEFRAYVNSRDLAKEYPGALGFGFIQRVPREELEQFVARERADHAPDFNLQVSGNEALLYIVKFTEPLDVNRPAWSLDASGDSIRRTALQQAIRTGQPTLSAHFQLVQDNTKRPGFLYFLPVYRNGTKPTTPEERDAALIGLIYCPVVIDRVFANLMADADQMLDVEVFDGTKPSREALLLDADGHLDTTSDVAAGYVHSQRLMHKTIHLEVGGRPWTLVMSSTPEFDALVTQREPKLLAIGGSLASVLLAALVFGLGNSRTQALTLARSITDSLRLTESEAKRLAMVASRTSNAVTITDAQDRIEWINDGFTRLTGYTLAEVKGRTPGSFLRGPLTTPESINAINQGLRTGAGFHAELVNYRKDGQPYSVEIEVQPLRNQDGLITGYMAIANDITERKRVASQLAANEQRLVNLTAEVPGAIFQFEVSPSGQRAFTFMSKGYWEMFGRDPEEAKARPVVLYTTVHPDDRAAVRATLEDAVRRGLPWQQSFRICKPDGTVRWIDARSTVAVQPDRTKIWFGVLNNITALQAARVTAEEAQQKAEHANRAKSQFLATMSHEIRTPMNGVIGMTSLLLDTPLNAQQREFVDIVRTSGESLLTLINDILDFSKIESGHLDLESAPFNLRDCVESTLDLFAHKSAQLGIDLLYEIAEGSPVEVKGDVTRLRQILVNLVGNALKFTERGEVILGVHPARADDGTPELHFSVKDTGIGIPPEAQPKLFQSFTQVDASTTRKYGGTGLGLAISKRLVELMGGRMWLESELGKGSTFHFSVRLEWLGTGPRRFTGHDRPRLAGRKILVVDDNSSSRRILAALAEKWRVSATVVSSGSDALQCLTTSGTPFDLAVLDMQMPGMDGVMLARAIHALPGREKLPLILLTSIGQNPEMNQAGLFSVVLTKPAKNSQLFDALSSVLNNDRAEVTPAPTITNIQPSENERRAERILLAEDNTVNQKVALHMLARLGYRADAVANGLEAVEAVRSRPYDIVLMDVQMPEMDGLEATRKIRSISTLANRPWIVALTANAMEGDRETCLAAGMDDYLGKPIKSHDLADALARARAALNPSA